MPRKTASRRPHTANPGAKSGTADRRRPTSPAGSRTGRTGVSVPPTASNRPPTPLPEQAPLAPTDPLEDLYARGLTDGLPVVPPTRERVERAIEACGRSADELIALVPPNYGRATVEKIAINAVMAGCRPEYLPVVIAAVEGACDPAFNLHGVATSTHFAAPLILVNGPVRARIGLNSSFGVFGPGFRANATVGRALRLLMINIGGGAPGDISMSTFGHPGRYTYCI